jgi:serine/threonine-protein kinase
VARGVFRYRFRLVRRDELGRLFAVFNLMNGALQARPRRARQTDIGVATEDVARPAQIPATPGRDDVAPRTRA